MICYINFADHRRERAMPTHIYKHATASAISVALTLAIGLSTAWAAAPIQAIGIENQYANVIQQIGGRYVSTTSIESNPNTDPHSFEASPQVAQQIGKAALIVENGLGYDNWADKIIAATAKPNQTIINVQHLLGLPDTTPNPHLWYNPTTMPAVAKAIGAALAKIEPVHAAYFRANVTAFDAALKPWLAAIAAFKSQHPGTPMAVTEPVGDYMLQAVGADIKTPFTLQAAIMNGTDPAPQDVATQNALFNQHKVKLFVYNQQVTDPLTTSFLDLAKKNHIPVVGVYETMPTPGYSYQSWMLAEVQALQRAVSAGESTRSLLGNK
jgi:zinc/manganese transport system substrate-binding protein